MATKKENRIKKEAIIQSIIGNLKEDFHKSKIHIFSLVYEALNQYELQDLEELKNEE